MLTIIVNPIAGSGRSVNELRNVEELLKKREVSYRLEYTKGPGDATRIAREACESGSDVGAMGGDGTFFEVINGVAGHDNVLYFLPSGTGNDFIKSIDLPNDPAKALEIQLDNEVSRIDYGKMNESYFLNVAGIGFDVMVLREADAFKKRFHGILPYLFGLIKALRKFRPIKCRISVDEKPVLEKMLTVLSIGNGQYIGGGMHAVPGANPWSGSFYCAMVDAVNRLQVIKFLPKFIKGSHINLPIVNTFECLKLELECAGMTVNMDGELRDVDRAVFSIVKKGLSVRCRKPAAYNE